jgi:hypothetical protein
MIHQVKRFPMANYKTTIQGTTGSIQFDPVEVDLSHALRTDKDVRYIVASQDTSHKKGDEEFSSVDRLKERYPKAKYKTVDKGERRVVSDEEVQKHLEMLAKNIGAGREGVGLIEKQYSDLYSQLVKDMEAQHEVRLNDERERARQSQKAHQELLDMLAQIDVNHGGLPLYLPLLHKDVNTLKQRVTELEAIIQAAGGMPSVERYLKDQARQALFAQKAQIDKELAKLG